jgi:hypothetical protein
VGKGVAVGGGVAVGEAVAVAVGVTVAVTDEVAVGVTVGVMVGVGADIPRVSDRARAETASSTTPCITSSASAEGLAQVADAIQTARSTSGRGRDDEYPCA